MKKLFLATTALVVLAAGSAAAADLPVAYKAPAPVRPACAQFGGFYLGANIGADYRSAYRNDDDGYFSFGFSDPGHTTTNSGWNGGVQGGYNWQRGCTVFGVEVDWSWSSTKVYYQAFPSFLAGERSINSKLNSFGTARTRTGIIVDDVMLYVTGGFAWANVDNTYTNNFIPGFEEQFSLSSTTWGWTAGAGSEWKFARNWSLKSEVLYMQFKQRQDTFFSPVAGNARFTGHDSVVVARMGVNYMFNSSPY
jgi:outer membrane immunogenic protein